MKGKPKKTDIIRAMRERKALAVVHPGEIQKFDPKKTALKDAKIDAVIEYAKRIKDWPLLKEAVEAKIEEHGNFVGWWTGAVRNEGRYKLTGADQGQLEKETGISHQQVSKWKKRLEHPDRYAQLLYGPSYKKAWGEVNKNYQEHHAARLWPKMIEDEFGLLYVDPPWQYDYSLSEQREVENQYPTMSLEEIGALKPPSAADCVLFFWATNPKLKDAFFILERWQFTYKTNAVWVKDRIGMGYYFRQQHELLLVATRGNPPTPQQSLRPPSVISAPRGEHSAKPVKVYELLESMYPDFGEKERVELFTRTPRPGWSHWPEDEYGWKK